MILLHSLQLRLSMWIDILKNPRTLNPHLRKTNDFQRSLVKTNKYILQLVYPYDFAGTPSAPSFFFFFET